MLLLLQILVACTVYPYDDGAEDEGHRRHDHQAVVDVACIVDGLRDDAETEQCARSEELADEGYDDEDNAVAGAIAYAVEERLPRLVAQGEGLEAPHQDTVRDDQPDVDGELLADIVGKGLEYLVDDRHQRGHNDQLDDDADAVGDRFAEQRNDDVGEGHDGRHGDGHDERRLQFDGHGQGRADAQHLHDDRIVLAQGVEQDLFILC